MTTTPGEQALRAYRGQSTYDLAVAVWNDLCAHGLRVQDAERPHDRGGVTLVLSDKTVWVAWELADERENELRGDNAAGLCSRTIGAVMTGALTASLTALGYQVHADFNDDLPMPMLTVGRRLERP
ncbi:hypothetical protein ACXZ65_31015 [Streptomyces aculeolatus]